MKTPVKILSIFVIAVLSFACSSAPSNKASNVNTAQATPLPSESPALVIAEITDANLALSEGNRLLDESNLEPAVEAFNKAIELNPELPEPYFKVALAYSLQEMQMEKNGIAIPTITVKDGKNGMITKTNSDRAFERAVAIYLKWLKANPDDHAAHFYLGRTYSKLQKDDEAEKELKQAVKLQPDDTEYQTELGAVLIKLAKYHEAIAPLKKAIELDESNDRAIALLDDAEAGRQRVDFVPKKKDDSQSNANLQSGSKTGQTDPEASNSDTATNTAGKATQQPEEKIKPQPKVTEKPQPKSQPVKKVDKKGNPDV